MSRLPSPRHPKTSALSVAQEGTQASAAWLPFESCVFVRLLYLIKIVPSPRLSVFYHESGGRGWCSAKKSEEKENHCPPLTTGALISETLQKAGQMEATSGTFLLENVSCKSWQPLRRGGKRQRTSRGFGSVCRCQRAQPAGRLFLQEETT